MREAQELRIWSLGQEDPLEKEMATHFNIRAWRIPWSEEPGGLQFIGSQRVRHYWGEFTCTHALTYLSWQIEKSYLVCCHSFQVTKSCLTLCDPMACSQPSLSFIVSRSLLKLMSIQSVMASNHLIICHPLLFLPSVFPSFRVFSNESALHIR